MSSLLGIAFPHNFFPAVNPIPESMAVLRNIFLKQRKDKLFPFRSIWVFPANRSGISLIASSRASMFDLKRPGDAYCKMIGGGYQNSIVVSKALTANKNITMLNPERNPNETRSSLSEVA